MIAVDTNLLVYAHRAESVFHQRAVDCLVELGESGAPWAIPWPCVHEFVAIVTHPRVCAPPSAWDVALDALRAWQVSPALRFIGEAPDHFDRLAQLVMDGRVSGPQVHDARIAAICLSHGVREFWSADRDFSRFPALRVVNPLVS